MPSGVAKSWLLFIALGLCFVTVGAIIDFLLKKEEHRKLHALFLRLALLLSDNPIKRWQVRIADVGYKALHSLHSVASEAIVSMVDDVFDAVIKVVLGHRSESLLHYTLFSFLCALVPFGYFFSRWWFLGSIAFPLMVLFLIIWIYLVIKKFDRSFCFEENFIIALIGIPIISAFLSLCATLLTLYCIPESLLNTHWYVLDQAGIKPSYPFLLPIVNLPFDLATIAVTMKLLAYVRSRRSAFLAVALLDNLLSLVFSVLLYAILLMIEGGWDILHFHQYLMSALGWFAEFFCCIGRFLIRSRPVGLGVCPSN